MGSSHEVTHVNSGFQADYRDYSYYGNGLPHNGNHGNHLQYNTKNTPNHNPDQKYSTNYQTDNYLTNYQTDRYSTNYQSENNYSASGASYPQNTANHGPHKMKGGGYLFRGSLSRSLSLRVRDPKYKIKTKDQGTEAQSDSVVQKKRENSSVSSDSRTASWMKVFHEFSQATTAHGVNKITDPTPYTARRIFWTLLVLLGIGTFFLQVAQNTTYFLSRPVTVNVKVNYNHTLQFPAVTICNQNAFRLTQAVETGFYEILTDIYSTGEQFHDFNFTKFGNISKSVMKDVYLQLAHQKEDLIVDCEWNHAACSLDDFESVLTDHGACVTFNRNQTPRHVSHTGADKGLRLQLNVEQYEYMKGPHNAAGLKILIHDQNEVPFVRDLGEAIPTGSTAFVGIRITSVQNLKPPYGNCDDSQKLAYYDIYSSSACRSSCRTDGAISHCGCRDIYMPSDGNSTDCTIEQHVNCIIPKVDLLSGEDEDCTCAVPCNSLHFQTTVTYSSASTMNVDSLLASPLTDGLRWRFQHARELLHRSVPHIIAKDKAAILDVVDKWAALEQQLQGVEEMINRTDEVFNKLLQDVNTRAYWHNTWGLQCIKVAIERNYMRGWEVMDERTLMHVTTGFYQQSTLFRQMVGHLLNSTDDALRTVWYVTTDRELTYRQELAAKSSANFTTLHLAYSSGERIYIFRLTPIYKFFSFDDYYNKALLEFLQAEQESKLYKRLHAYMISYLEQIKVLRQIARTLYENGTIDLEAMEAAIAVFEKRSRNYNYYRYMYRETVILKSQSVAVERIEYFSSLNDTMQSHVDNLRLAISNIRDLLNDFKVNYQGQIADSIGLAHDYLANSTIKKSILAEIMTSRKMADILRGVSTFYKNIHTRGQQLKDAWGHFKVSSERVWMTILRETSLRPHYEHIRRTVLKALTPNETEFQATIQPKLAEMLRISVDDFLNLPDDVIIQRTNADIATLTEGLLKVKLDQQFTGVKQNLSEITKLTLTAESFLSQTEKLQARMDDFIKISTIDANFFKDNFLELNVFMSDLSYEEIDQQIGYDFIALVSDIGGSMGLFIGASIMTVFEVLDVLIHNLFLIRYFHRQPNSRGAT